MQSDIRLASFDDHYLYDSLTIPVDTIRQTIASWRGIALI